MSQRLVVSEDDWIGPEPGYERYGPNQMIGSFTAGVRTGVDRLIALADQQFGGNKQKAGVLTASVLEELRQRNFHPSSAKLRITNWDEFEVLIALSKEEFLNDSLLRVLDYTTELTQRETNATFSIEFHFFGKGEKYDDMKVISEGYIYFHKSIAQ
ncbi:MAG: hypothetical protein Q8896_01490 [Bacteroidota bacterium]|nr:hypothetical protein [Bacteroidota bacterium]MDP4235673.1 hypothetical protein [Bacteroidota bacterium]